MQKKRKHVVRDRVASADVDFEITFMENILKESPRFLEALVVLGDLYTKKGLYQKGLEIDRRLAELRGDDPYVLYNLACSYSLMQEVKKAVSVMKKAIRCGYQDFTHLERDKDLINLLGNEQFREYLESQKRKRSSSGSSH